MSWHETSELALKELQEYFSERNVEVINIGDSARTRKIIDGVQ